MKILRTVNILQNVRHFHGLIGSLHCCQARVEEVFITTDQRWEGNALGLTYSAHPLSELCLMQPILPTPWVLTLFFSGWVP